MDRKSPFGLKPRQLNRLLAIAREGDLPDAGAEADQPGAAKDAAAEPLPSWIGRYKVVSVLGEGGMGIVYLARQEHPIERTVAVKLIKPGMDSQQVIARFEAERQALALLDHPHIAHVLDAGTTEAGRPYFVMEYVAGLSITEYCDRHKLTIRQRLSLFLQVCEAIQHAHQKGIIHRDIKPSNILVSVEDGKAVPKVIDFGVAKALAQPLSERTFYTTDGQLVGTPAYMSPEQADLRDKEVDIRSDVYSLGVVLYVLLTGALPFESQTFQEGGIEEIRRTIREEDPAAPSTRLSKLGEHATRAAECRKTNVSTLAKKLKSELEWIPLKAMQKERERRYQSTAELATDIQSYLDGMPLVAGPPSGLYRVKKFVRRHRAAVLIGVLVVALTLATILALSISTVLIAQQRKQTQQALEREQQAFRQETQARHEAVQQRDMAYRHQYIAQMRLAPQYWQSGQTMALNEMLEEYLPQPGQTDLRGWEWYYLLSSCHMDLLTLRGHGAVISSVAWSPDGRWLASGDNRGATRIWEAATGTLAATLMDHRGPVSVAWSPDSKLIATAGRSQYVRISESVTGQEHATIAAPTLLSGVVWSPDGQYLAALTVENTVLVWDAVTHRELTHLGGEATGFSAVSWNPDGTGLAAVENPSTLRVWRIPTGQELFRVLAHSNEAWSVDWHPAGTRIATAGYDRHLKVWDATTGAKMLDIPHDGAIHQCVWSPDGSRLAVATRSQRVRIWDGDRGHERLNLRGHTGWVNAVAWSPDGTRIASGGDDRLVKIWDALSDRRCLVRPHADARRVAWDPHGDVLVSAGGNEIKVWNPATGDLIRSWTHEIDHCIATWSPGGRHLACGAGVRTEDAVIIWDVNTASEVSRPPRGCSVSWSPDRRSLAIVRAKQVILWDLATQRIRHTLTGHEENIWSVAWSPDSRILGTTAWDGLVKIWVAATGQELFTLKGHRRGKWVATLAWNPDNRTLATGGWDQTIKVWDTALGREIRSLRAHTGYVRALAWSPDGQRLASGSADTTVKLWDKQTGRELLTLRGHSDAVQSVAWSPDGRSLATASLDGTVRIWSTAKGHQVMDDRAYWQDRMERYRRLAHALQQSGRYSEASEAWDQVQWLDPNNAELYLRRGIIRQRHLGQAEPALSDLYRALELEPNAPQADAEIAWILAADPQTDPSDATCAVTHALRAVRASPENRVYLGTLGLAYYQADRWQEAVQTLSPFAPFNGPEDGFTDFVLAMAYERLGQDQAARRHYERAIEWWEGRDGGYLGAHLGCRLEAARVLGMNPTAARSRASLNDAVLSCVTVTSGGPGSIGRGAVALLDGSGLTERDQTGHTVHSHEPETMWAAATGFQGTTLEFDLGGLHRLRLIKLWNYNETGHTQRGIRRVDLSCWTEKEGWQKVYQDLPVEEAPGHAHYDTPARIVLGGLKAQKVRLEDLVNHGDPTHVGLSEIQFYDLCGSQASELKPPDKAGLRNVPGIRRRVRLSWTPGLDAGHHHVYLGESPEECPLLAKDVKLNYVKTPALDSFQTYYWRVDAVKPDGSVTPGEVCGFTIGRGSEPGTTGGSATEVPARSQKNVKPAAGLVSWWPGNGSAEDIVGANDGILINGTTFGPGLIDEAFVLDGIDDCVRVPYSEDLYPESLTLEAWIKPHRTDKASHIIHTRLIYGLSIARDSLMCCVSPSSMGLKRSCGFPSGLARLTADQWNHVACTWDAATGQLIMYVNGSEAAIQERGTDNPLNASEDAICMGSLNSGGSFFSGLIDEPALYNRALTALEIRDIYRRGNQ